MTREEFFKFFELKIRCAINQIRHRGFAISYSEFGIIEVNGHYAISHRKIVNPLSIIIENRYKKPTYKSSIDATSKILDCDVNIIRHFRDGFSGRMIGTSTTDTKTSHKKYYILGAQLRKELKQASISAHYANIINDDIF